MSSEADRVASYRSEPIDALKGVLILLVILGHNYYFGNYYPLWFNALYNFHVASFLLLPFLFSMRALEIGPFRDRVVRALAPQLAFLGMALVAYFALYVEKSGAGIADWLLAVGVALLVQNEEVLNSAAGFRHFWFLPAMITMMCLLYLYDRGALWVRRAILGGAFVWHLTIGLVPLEVARYIPWGLPIVGFLLLPGLLVRYFYGRIRWRPLGDLLLIGLWIALLFLVVKWRLFMGLAGDLGSVRSLLDPARLLFHGFFLLLSFFALLRLAAYLPSLFAKLGQVSLKLFLIVPLLWQIFWMAGGSRLSAESDVGLLLLVLGSMVLMVALGYALSRWIEQSRWNALLFPRSLAQWSQGLRPWQRER